MLRKSDTHITFRSVGNPFPPVRCPARAAPGSPHRRGRSFFGYATNQHAQWYAVDLCGALLVTTLLAASPQGIKPAHAGRLSEQRCTQCWQRCTAAVATLPPAVVVAITFVILGRSLNAGVGNTKQNKTARNHDGCEMGYSNYLAHGTFPSNKIFPEGNAHFLKFHKRGECNLLLTRAHSDGIGSAL